MKKLFSYGIYKDALRRTKPLMIALLIIAVFFTGIQLIGNLSEFSMYKSNGESMAFIAYDSLTSIAGILPVYVFILGAGLAIAGFSFLNKRNSSDFYHAIPYSRTTLYLSTMAAIVTQIVIMLFVALAIPTFGSLISGMGFCYRLLPRVFLVMFVGTLLVSSVTAFAISVTGTAFSNLILTAIVLFLPRFITALAAGIISNKTTIVPMDSLGVMFTPSYNIPVGLITASFDFGNNIDSIFANIYSSIYTLIIAIIYIALGNIVFSKRKSEMAGSSAPSKVLQCIYRCAVGLVFALILVTVLLTDSESLTLNLILLACSFISFLLFELITTKSFKNMLKSIPSYGFVIAISILFLGIVSLSSSLLLKVKPNSNEIKSIQVAYNTTSFIDFSGNNYSYSDMCLKQAKVKSTEAIDIAVNEFESTLTEITSDLPQNQRYIDETGNMIRNEVYITFNLNDGRNLKRLVYFNSSNYNKFTAALYKDSAYTNAVKALPQNNEIVDIAVQGLSRSDSEKLWRFFESEVQSKNIDLTSQPQNCTDSISVAGFKGFEKFNENYPISIEDMPDTTKALMKYMNQSASKNNIIEEAIEYSKHNIDQNNDDKYFYSADYNISILDYNYAQQRAEKLDIAFLFNNSEINQGLSIEYYIPSIDEYMEYMNEIYKDNATNENDKACEKQKFIIKMLQKGELTNSPSETAVRINVSMNKRDMQDYTNEYKNYIFFIKLDTGSYDELLLGLSEEYNFLINSENPDDFSEVDVNNSDSTTSDGNN